MTAPPIEYFEEDWPDSENWEKVHVEILEPFDEYSLGYSIVLRAPDGKYWEGDLHYNCDYGRLDEHFSVRQVTPRKVEKTVWVTVNE